MTLTGEILPVPPSFFALVPVCSRPRFLPRVQQEGGARCRVVVQRPGCNCNQNLMRGVVQRRGGLLFFLCKPGEISRVGRLGRHAAQGSASK